MVESHPAHDSGRIFVGRHREMVELTAALNDALTGHGRMVVLAGEPGIGKTRTAEELAVLAETRGAQVLWGRCYEEQGAPPYWPWVLWTQSPTPCGMPIETSKSPPTPTFTRVSRASRTVRRSPLGSRSPAGHAYALSGLSGLSASLHR